MRIFTAELHGQKGHYISTTMKRKYSVMVNIANSTDLHSLMQQTIQLRHKP